MPDEVFKSLIVKQLEIDEKLEGSSAGSGAVLNVAATDAIPSLIPNKDDTNSGIGQAQPDAISIISGGIQAMRFVESGNDIIQLVDSNVGLTADTGSVQGSGIITSSYNVYDTVANAGDAATLPSAFSVGTIIYIKNGAAANAMDVFPASGDDCGAGANTAVSIAAGDFAVFLATAASATWEKIMGGTA